MPAEIERTLLDAIPDVEDRELRVSLVRYPDNPEFGEYREVSYYIPSRDLYTLGYAFPEEFTPRIVAALKTKRPPA